MLARLAEVHPRSPAAARLKAAVLFAGVRYDTCIAEAADWAAPGYRPHPLPPDAPAFRGRRRVTVPHLMQLADGTLVRLRIKPDSPFVIRPEAEPRRYTLYEGETRLTGLTFEAAPAWLDNADPELRAAGLTQHGDMLVANPAPGCEYFGVPSDTGGRPRNLSCQFCLYGLPDQRAISQGQRIGEPLLPKATLDRLVGACLAADAEARHLYLVAGSMLDMRAEGERYVQIARHLAAAGLADRYYLACGSGAIHREHMVELRDAGVRGVCFNLEVWGQTQFARVCPGKDRAVGYDRWLESLCEAVDVFGGDDVHTAFVCGVELDGKGAITDPAEALENNIAAAEWLIPRGIQPIFSIYWRVTGKNAGEEPVYTLDNFLALNEATAALRARENRTINTDFVCRRCAYMQLEPDYDGAPATEGQAE